ncbi:dipeptidase [Gordonia sp. CPCC 205333]|uniref:dipeptidase n=1 Tax=Gordonia sp. CPCC 205333 TaxID=3140790 RepID=UPI003AF35635
MTTRRASSNALESIPLGIREIARKLLDRSVVADAHGHPQAVVPGPVRRAAERLADVPHDPLTSFSDGLVNLAIITAVGDPMGTVARPRSPLATVVKQLEATRREAFTAGLPVATSVADIRPDSATRILLGIEGGDVVGDDPDCLPRLFDAGVRVIGLVHYADNAIGTIGTSIVGRRGSRTVRAGSRSPGLTRLGVEIVTEMNRLGIVIDLAHADRSTTVDTCEQSTAPVISSHTAAAALRDFPRYISDAEIEAIAATGGLIGLWPARVGSMAMTDLDDFARHAQHLADLVGTEHICIGTDKNGVTAYAYGYRGSEDFVNLAAALLHVGFSTVDVEQIIGRNLHRVTASIIEPATES